MTDTLKSLPSAPYHFLLYLAVVWRLYYILSFPSFVVAASALLWLVVRLDRVLKQPVDDLIRILGLEVPVAPAVSLLDISSDSASIHWKALEKKADTKYAILVNGVSIGEVSPADSSVTIKGLASGVCYTVRVVAINGQNFQASSDPVGVQTCRRTADDLSGDGSLSTLSTRKAAVATAPAIVPYKGPFEGLVPPLLAQGATKEHRLSVSQKQPNPQRRASPLPAFDASDDDSSRHCSSEQARQMVQQLQTRLNELKEETDDLDRQDEEDEHQAQAERQALMERRDAVRQELKDKEDDSKELKKVVNQLERRYATVQQRKTNLERALENRRQEQRRLHEDRERWDREAARLQEQSEALKEQKEQYEIETQQLLERAREEREPVLQAMRQLDEHIQHVGRQIKDLEESRPGPSSPLSEADMKRAEEDREFNERMTSMRTTIQRIWLENDSTKKAIAQLQQRVNTLSMPQRRGSQYDQHIMNDPFTSSPDSRLSQRQMVPFTSSADFDPRTAFATASPQRIPFLHADLHADSNGFDASGQSEIDRLTGGALASPSANALLPSDLLGDDIEDINRRAQINRLSAVRPDSSGSRPASTAPPPAMSQNESRWPATEETNLLPGLGNVPNTGSSVALGHAGPNSPTAMDSPSSITSSPHESTSAFHPHRVSDGYMDSDRRSIRSTSSSSRMAHGRSRFLGDIFGRQRGKTDADEGPALGALKKTQTRSMPRSYEGEDDDPEQKRVSSASFLGSVSHGLLGRRAHGHTIDEEGQPRPGPSHRAGPLGRLGSRVNPWASDLDANTRPSSVYSAENVFPQPFGWNGSGVGLDRSNTTASARAIRSPWSPYTSRRGSIQVETAGGNPSFSELSLPDDDSLPFNDDDAEKPAQAPIGTKPSRFSKKKSPQIGRSSSPGGAGGTTRDIKRLFGSKKPSSSSSKAASKKTAPSLSSSDTPDHLQPDRRRSADLASLSATTASTDDDGGYRDVSAPGTPGTPGTDGTPTGRESLMRKLTRKSSYIPGLKSRKSTAPNTPQLGGPANDSDDDGAHIGSGNGNSLHASSIASSPKVSAEERNNPLRLTTTTTASSGVSTSGATPTDSKAGKRSSGFSLSTFKRRRRDRETAAAALSPAALTPGAPPSVSGASVTSETTGDGDDDEARSVSDL